MVLMMAQLDDVSGEILGEFIRRAEAAGARNIQIVPSLTKKGRPAHLVFVDAPQDAEPAIAELFGAELGTWGYRVMQAEHRHFDIRRTQVSVVVRHGQAEQAFTVRVKVISNGGRVLRVKAEFDDLSAACGALRDRACLLPIAELKAAVEDRFDRDAPEPPAIVLER